MSDIENPQSAEQPSAGQPAAEQQVVAADSAAPAAPAVVESVAASPTESAVAPAEPVIAAELVDETPVVVAPRYGELAAPTTAPAAAAGGTPVAAADAAPSGAAQEPETAPAAPGATRRRIWIPALAAGGVLGLILGGGAGALTASLVANGGGSGTPVGAATGAQTVTINDSSDVSTITAVATNAMPSVVTISVTGTSASGTGSGIVIDDQGDIVTNTHVVTIDGSEASPTIEVTTSSGRVYDATIVGEDPLMDIAVIRVTGATDLTPITFADSSKLNVGETAVAIGAPLGLSGTVTSGIVSSVDRSIEVASSAAPETSSGDGSDDGSGGDSSDPFNYFQFEYPGNDGSSSSTTSTSSTIQLPVIQTDTAINPGNSGGALLDSTGALIGMNVAIATASSSSSTDSQSGSIGVGFAIPANVVQRVADELISSGSATHGLLGASVADVADDPAQADAGVVGASIVELVSGGAAETAGLEVGDIITSVDGVPVTGKTDATAQIRSQAAGATVTIGYDRGGSAYTLDVTLGAYTAS